VPLVSVRVRTGTNVDECERTYANYKHNYNYNYNYKRKRNYNYKHKYNLNYNSNRAWQMPNFHRFSTELCTKVLWVPLPAQRGAFCTALRCVNVPPIFLLERKTGRTRSKKKSRGDFDFPPDPLETTQRGGLHPQGARRIRKALKRQRLRCGPPLWIPLPEGCKPINCAPHERLAKRKARRGCRVSASVAGYRLKGVQTAIERHFV